jgi:hypothetical protein
VQLDVLQNHLEQSKWRTWNAEKRSDLFPLQSRSSTMVPGPGRGHDGIKGSNDARLR